MVLDHLQREREREREVGTLLWKPWTRQVMKNVVPSCPFYYTETLTHSATFLFLRICLCSFHFASRCLLLKRAVVYMCPCYKINCICAPAFFFFFFFEQIIVCFFFSLSFHVQCTILTNLILSTNNINQNLPLA